MKPLPKPRTECDLPPLTLYLDDVYEISSILLQLSNQVTMRTDEFALDDIKELENIGGDQIHELLIVSRTPDFSIRLMPRDATISTSDDSISGVGAYEKIRRILQSRKRKYALANSTLTGITWGALIGLLLSALLMSLLLGWATWESVALAAMASSVIIWLWKSLWGSYCTIVLSLRNRHASFWKRNQDNLKLALISAIAGGLVTVVGELLLRFLGLLH